MKRSIVLTALLGTVSLLAAHESIASARTSGREPTRTVWDSVYTDSQAARGDSVYKASCATCHGATLAGTDSANALAGASFLDNWDGLGVDELYEKIRTTMPPDRPKSIPAPQLAEVVAYVLAQNHFPAGTKALSDSTSALKAVKILKAKP